MTSIKSRHHAAWFAVVLGSAVVLGLSSGVLAQQPGGTQSSAALAKRVEQLEEQLVDLRVVIGTLESLSRSGGAAAAPALGGLGANEAARIEGMETQIRALTAQVEQLSRQVQAGSGQVAPAGTGRGIGGAGAFSPASPTSAAPAYGSGARGLGTEGLGTPEFGGFGSTTVTSDAGPEEDPIGGLLSQDEGQAGFGTQVAAAPMGAGNPKQVYETAYGYLLQQDYGAAEVAFNEFLKKYPNDQLAGNAQYWLGETYFVRSQYKAAAAAFLKGYEAYRQSPKAPDSLLKLAMSLDRLGQREAACSSLSELNAQFPGAPQHVRDRASTERSRVGC